MSLKAEIARLKAELAGRKVRPVNPVDLMTIDELDAELARLEATEKTIHADLVDYWLKLGYSPDNAERLASY